MGNRLFREVTDLTGLPKNLISEELAEILGRVGATPSAVTLDDLRTAMAMYLTEVIGPNMDVRAQDNGESSQQQEPTPDGPTA